VFSGVLIAESLRSGTTLDRLSIVVRRIRRVSQPDATADQPSTWTLIEFELDGADGDAFAQTLAASLDAPGWYADFRSATDSFVVFPNRVFRYARGDAAARSEAAAFGRSLGIPESQLDWPV